MVMPPPWSWRITSNIWSTTMGASPREGSSSSSTLGSDIRARPMAHICCSPPERLPATCDLRSSSRGKRPWTRSRFCFTRARARPWYAPSSRFSRTVSCGHSSRPSGTRAMPMPARSAAGARESDWPLNRTSPLRGGSTPMMQRRVVVLPAPLLPSSVTISLSRTSSASEKSTCTSPYPASIPRTSSMLLPQIRLDHDRVLHHLARRPRGDQLAGLQDRHVLAEAHHRRHHVLGHEDGDAALVADAADQRHHLPRLHRVDAGDHLVEQERLGDATERAGHLQPLASGEGEAAGVLVPALVEPDELEHLARQLARAGGAAPGALRGGDRAVLQQGQV